ncbi:heparinase II/III family protein [Arthrobacter sp. JCM 19049]|uniref:heparinase II/III domain-containing protein n=1 Tax=Arthrobacter sp. JCM 19049 TaxID=1460643 RepID=UPI002436E1CF|nr:heparinase II/III family protein [Arthrobacter sp. JCM 19049]
MDELHKDEAFNPGNNHGFYTAASQLHLHKFGRAIPGIEYTGNVGAKRMSVMVDKQFAEDGVHLEHSPGYHQMLLSSFEAAINDGLIQNEEIRERIRRAAHVLGWMIQPDGHLVQFGDTQDTLMQSVLATSLDPETQFVLTGGMSGTAPVAELAVFNDGGYAFVRSPAPQTSSEIASAGYLAFSAAFHSRAHKHADDLNIVWYDRGSEILVDSGRYGYGDFLPADSPQRAQGFYYASMERQYVEGTSAHNTLMMDGADQLRRGRIPYGSGIIEATHTAGSFDISARANHTDYLHRRRVVYRPGRKLQVLDSVYSHNQESREATIWFNIDGRFELIEFGDTLVFERRTGTDGLRLEVSGPGTRLEPVLGGNDPLRGWRSRTDRTLEPVWSIGYTVPVQTRASVSTTFRFI